VHATLVATGKLRFLAFMRTQNPHRTRSRRTLPSVTGQRSNKDSLISTIGTSFPWANRGQNPHKTDASMPGFAFCLSGLAWCGSGTFALPRLGKMVRKGLISKEFS